MLVFFNLTIHFFSIFANYKKVIIQKLQSAKQLIDFQFIE